MTTYYDPPSGWKYGFPKRYKPLNDDEPLTDTLARDGYPAHEITDRTANDCGFWEAEDEPLEPPPKAAT